MTGYDFSGLNILVADENRFELSIIRQHLRAYEATNVFEAHDGEEAYHILQAKKIDIALIDFEMTPVSGTAFVRMVRTDEKSLIRPFPLSCLSTMRM